MSAGKEKKAAALEEKLQLLRSVTKSNAGNKTSILVHASNYIRELKDKVDEAAAAAADDDDDDDDDDSSSGSTPANTSSCCSAALLPAGTVVSVVSAVDLAGGGGGGSRTRGFRINVSSTGRRRRSRPGLLVSVLEALEELGLDVLDADVSCGGGDADDDDDTPFFLRAALGGGPAAGRRRRHGGHQQGTSTVVDVDEETVRQAVSHAIRRITID